MRVYVCVCVRERERECVCVCVCVNQSCVAGHRPSPILLASGVARGVAANALRVSVGRDTSTSDVDLFLSDLAQARGTLLPPPATAPDDSHVTSGHN